MEFESPLYFILLLLLVPYIIWYFLLRNNGKRKAEVSICLSDTNVYRNAPVSWRVRLMGVPMALRCIAFILIVIALARPQTRNAWNEKTVEGIDIMLAMDVSTSMLAEDLKPNRIEAAKAVAGEFIADRPFFYIISEQSTGAIFFMGQYVGEGSVTDPTQDPCDINQDGVIDVADIGHIIDAMAGNQSSSLTGNTDVNGDGAVDVADISAIITRMAEK